jgi:hypothetical protein
MSSVDPIQEAMSQLVLLALSEEQGGLSDDAGRATARLRELCGLPDQKPITALLRKTLKTLEEEKVIAIVRNSTRTSRIGLVRTLGKKRVGALRRAEESNRALIMPPADVSEVDAPDEPDSTDTSSAPGAPGIIDQLVKIIDDLERELDDLKDVRQENADLRTKVGALEMKVDALEHDLASDDPHVQDILNRYPS